MKITYGDFVTPASNHKTLYGMVVSVSNFFIQTLFFVAVIMYPNSKCFCFVFFYFTIKVNPEYVSQFEEKGMKFVGRDVEGERMEIMEIKGTWLK